MSIVTVEVSTHANYQPHKSHREEMANPWHHGQRQHHEQYAQYDHVREPFHSLVKLTRG